MRRSANARAFTLIETVVALGLGGMLIAGTVYYFTNFSKAVNHGDRRADSRNDVLSAGALIQSVFTRRNVTLDTDTSAATASYKVVQGVASELTIFTRPSSTATTSAAYRFRNVCRSAPAGAPALPAAVTGRCGFSCPAGQASSIELQVTDKGSSNTRLLVAASDKLQPGGLASAALCMMKPAVGAPPLDEILVEVVARLYGQTVGSLGGEISTLENLTLTVRDVNVEFTGRD